jgi:ribosomal protein S18 acetylase RimI-like enzyme
VSITIMDDPIVEHRFEGPRPARLEERDQLIDMVNVVFRLSVGREPTIATDWPHVYAPANLENVMVVSDQGRLVASAGVWANDIRVGDVALRVGGINCVGTLQEYRRHGLGSQVMEAAQSKMAELGCHAGLLVTGISNWYRRLGWDDAGCVRTYRLNRGNIALLPRLPDGLRIRFTEVSASRAEQESKKEAITEALRLHNSAQLGAVRTAEGFRQLLAAKKNPRIVLAESESVSAPVAGQEAKPATASAYLLLRDHSVVEWAGPAEIVAGLVRACFERLDDPAASTSQRDSGDGPALLRTLTLTAPGWQHPLVALLDRARIPHTIEYLGMIYVVDPQALLDAYGLSSICSVSSPASLAGTSRVDVAHMATAGQEFVLTYKGESTKFSHNQLAKLFFGPERITDFAADIFPLPFWQWNLEKV